MLAEKREDNRGERPRMTIETKTTIQLNDVKAVEFECKNCHRITIVPIQVAKSIPISCQCESPHWMSVNGEMHQGLIRLMELLGRFGEANREPFSSRFVIDGTSGRASTAKD